MLYFFAGCLLFTIVFSSGWRYSDSYIIQEIDPSTRPQCLHEGLEMDNCFHVVYKAGWTDCYMFDECNTCTPFTTSGYDKYDFDCTAGKCSTLLSFRQKIVEFASSVDLDESVHYEQPSLEQKCLPCSL